MSMRTIAASSPKSASASVRASSVLPTPVGPRNRKQPIGRFGVRESGPRAADGLGDRLDGLVLPDDPLVQLLLEAHEPLALLLGELGDRDAGGPGDDLGYVLGRHLGDALGALARLLELALCSSSTGP